MKNKKLKVLLIAIAIGGLAFAGYRVGEYLTGTIRLKYSVIKMQKYKDAPEETPLEE